MNPVMSDPFSGYGGDGSSGGGLANNPEEDEVSQTQTRIALSSDSTNSNTSTAVGDLAYV